MDRSFCPSSAPAGTTVADQQSIHSCDRCSAVFRSSGLLARHIARLHQQKKYNCGHCEAGFNSAKNFALHRAIHGPKPFKCPKCAIVFRRHATLVGHIERHYTREHTCAVCDREFVTLDELRAHVYEGHEEAVGRGPKKINVVQGATKKTYKCKLCEDKIFTKKSLLERHFLVHTKHKPFKCEICAKSFNQKCTLKTHLLTHSNVQDFVCLLCGLKFSQKVNLRVHTLRMHPKRTASVADRLPCPYCPCLFKKLGSLNAHKTKVHAALLPDPTKGNDEQTVLEPPEEITTDSGVRLAAVFAYKCDRCEINFPDSRRLGKHMEIHQDAGHPANSANLEPEVVQPVVASRTQHHLLEGQSEVRQHACTICPAAFKKVSHLTQHIRSHYGIKGNRCEICNKTFTTSHTLKVHRNSHNQNGPDFRCDQCPASFSLQSSLRRHTAIHDHPDRSYSCPICKRVFKWFQNCRTHIRSTHGKDAEGEASVDPVVTTTEGFDAGSNPKSEPPVPGQDSVETLIDLNNLPPNVQIYDINSLTNCLVRIDDQFYELPVQIETDQLSQGQHFVEIVHDVTTLEQPEQLNLTPTEDSLYQYINEASNDELVQEEILDQSDKPLDAKPKSKDKKLPNLTEQDLFSEILLNGKKTYSCKGCQKTFKKPIDLRRHIRTHTGERPFKCDQCAKSFTLKAVLQEHQRTHEDRREMLACGVDGCAGKFSSKASLELHRRIHSGDRPFRCTVCALTFRTSGHMQAHMVSHERLAAKRERNVLEFT